MKTKFEKLIEKSETAFAKYSFVCDNICNEAQKYVDWADLRWEYLPSDGLCFGIEGYYEIEELCNYLIDDMTLVSAYIFFKLVSEKSKVTPIDFKNSSI